MYRSVQHAFRVRPFISSFALDLPRSPFQNPLFCFKRPCTSSLATHLLSNTWLRFSKKYLISDTASPRQHRHAGLSLAGLPLYLFLPFISSPSARLSCRILVLILPWTLIYITSLAWPRQNQAIGPPPLCGVWVSIYRHRWVVVSVQLPQPLSLRFW